MGWAARANPKAQAARRREIAPKPKAERPTFRRKDIAKAWAMFLARLAGKTTETKTAATATSTQ